MNTSGLGVCRRVTLVLGLVAVVTTLGTGCGYVAGAVLVVTSSGGGGSSGASNLAPVAAIDLVPRQTGDITITYTLTDVNEDEASITVEYGTIPYPGTGDPTAWFPCLEAGGDGVMDLATSKTGTSHTFVWDAPTDLGDGTNYDGTFAQVRITPRDAVNANLVGNVVTTSTFIAGNNLPTAVIDPAIVGTTQAGLVQIDYSVTDTTGDRIDIDVEFSDVGPTGPWTAATIPVGETSGLSTSPTGEPHNFVWDSDADGVVNSTVWFRITPSDALTTPGGGIPSTPVSFDIENNTPPLAIIASPTKGEKAGIDVEISYLLLDDDNDTLSVLVEYSTDRGLSYLVAAEQPGFPSEGTTNLSSSTTGVSHTFVWDSYTDLPDLDLPGIVVAEPVWLRITPSDQALGDPGEVEDVRLDNNAEPSAAVSTPAGDQQGIASIDFVLTDPEADVVDAAVDFSTDGGANFSPITIVSSPPGTTIVGNTILDLSSSPGGVNHAFGWDTTAEFAGIRSEVVVLRIQPTDNADPDLGAGLEARTDLFIVDNTIAPLVTISPVTSPASGTVMVTYTLIDAESNPVDVDVQFSTGGLAGPFAPAIRDTLLGDGVSGLASSPVGIAHTFAWDSLADLGPSLEPTVAVRIIPSDTKVGAPDNSNVFTLDNNNAPLIVVDTPTGTQSGSVIITYTLFDTNSDLVAIAVEWSTDGGATYDPLPATECTACVSPPSDGISGIDSSPAGTPHIFIWDSIADISLTSTSSARIRITPSDSLTGASSESGVFVVDNGSLVPIVIIDPVPRSYVDAVVIPYKILDGNSSQADLVAEYAVGAAPFVPASDAGPGAGSDGVSFLSTSPGGVSHTFVWDSATDLGPGEVTDITFRLTPSDIDGPGIDDTSNPFIRGNAAPSVTINSPTNGSSLSGLVRVEVDLVDSSSDPVDLAVEYDAGSGFQPATITVGGTTGLASSPGGTLHTFAWNSIADLGVIEVFGVNLRVTPTDDEPLSGSPSSVSFDLQNNDLPVAVAGAPAAGDVKDGLISIDYVLIDGDADLIDIAVRYSTDGLAYAPVAPGPGGDGMGGLSSSPDGDSHTFAWDSAADIVLVDEETVTVEITPSDPQNTGAPAFTKVFLVNNNVEPTVQSIAPFGPGDQSGDVTVDFTLADPESDDSIITVSYSVDGGGTFLAATLRKVDPGDPGVVSGNEISALPASPGGSARRLIWESATDLPGAREIAVVLRIEPRDHPTNFALGLGVGAQTSVFAVDNTSAPVINNLAVTGSSDAVAVSYDLYDAEPPTGPTVEIEVTYSLDGISFFPATISNPDEGSKFENIIQGQTPSNTGAGAPHGFDWDTVADVGEVDQAGVTLRLVPMDTQLGGPADVSVDLFNNDAPIVAIGDITGVQTGDVVVSYSLRDSNADTCSIVVEYRIGTGAYTPASESSGPPSEGTWPLSSSTDSAGAAHIFVWDSKTDLSTTHHGDLQIRITPSDLLVSGIPAVSSIFTVDNAIVADLVLGKPNFDVGAIDGRGVQTDFYGVSVYGSKLFVADTFNNRVLIFDPLPTSNFQTADVVLGQRDFTTGQVNQGAPFGQRNAQTLYQPTGIWTDGTRFFVSDRFNNRIAVWEGIPTASYAPMDHVLGQTSKTGSGFGAQANRMHYPWDVHGDASHLYVADMYNHRVLIFNRPIDFSGGDGPPADYVLGQADFGLNGRDRNQPAPDAGTMDEPYGVHTDGTTLFVADSANHRVLMWTIPGTWSKGLPADAVVGQSTWNGQSPNAGGRSLATLYRPRSIWVQDGKTYVADDWNHRVLVWNNPAPASFSAADLVLGQSVGTTGNVDDGGLDATSLHYPKAVTSTGNELIIADSGNARVKIHQDIVGTPLVTDDDAEVVFGQPDFSTDLVNHEDVKARTLRTPAGITAVGSTLLVADVRSRRVLGWTPIPEVSNKNAGLVLGHTTFDTWVTPGGTQGDTLYNPVEIVYNPTDDQYMVSDQAYNRIVVYDGPLDIGEAGVAFIGQTGPTSSSWGSAANRFNSPAGIAWDDAAGALWVADHNNNRVLRFPKPLATNMDADLVLGQADFTQNGLRHSGTDPGIAGDQSLHWVEDVEVVDDGLGGKLLVADSNQSRVVVWEPIPSFVDEAASFVIGQTNWTNNSSRQGRDGLSQPKGVTSDGTRVVVMDSLNNRIMIWDTFPTAHGAPADRIIGQPNFTENTPNNGGISSRSLSTGLGSISTYSMPPLIVDDAGTIRLWAPDQNNNRVLRYDITP